MRIAISGTHCCGKSTLIEAFRLRHRDYVHEPEAYEALQEFYGEGFGDEPTADDFYRQLEYQVDRLRQYGVGDRVIFERSPVDYLAYLLALGDLDRDTAWADPPARRSSYQLPLEPPPEVLPPPKPELELELLNEAEELSESGSDGVRYSQLLACPQWTQTSSTRTRPPEYRVAASSVVRLLRSVRAAQPGQCL